MIYMKVTDTVASWIVKLPAFRIFRLIRLFRMFQRREIIRIQSAFKDQLTYFILKSCVILLFFSCFVVDDLIS